MYTVTFWMKDGTIHTFEAESAPQALEYADSHHKGYVRLEAKSQNAFMQWGKYLPASVH